MKKYFLSIIVFLFIFLSCENKKADKKQKTDTNKLTQEKISANTPYLKGKTFKIKITLIELGSVRCIPCKMMMPILKEIEENYGNEVKVIFYDVWTEEGRPYAEKYQMRAIPTQIFLDENGKEFFRHVGFFPREQLFEVLKKKGVNIK